MLVTMSDSKETDSKRGDEKYNLTEWYKTSSDEDWNIYGKWNGVTLDDLSRNDTRVSDGTHTYRLNSSTVYLFVESSMNDLDVSVYTGGVSYEWQAADRALVITEGGSMTARYVIIKTADASQSAEYSEDVIFIKSLSSETGDGYISQTVYLPDGSEETWDIAEGEITARDLPGFFTYDTDEDGYYILDDAEEMSITKSFIWDGEEGVIANAVVDSEDDLYDTLLTVTVGSYDVEDIEIDGATFEDLHDTDGTDEYTSSISSLSRLIDRIESGRVKKATLYLNVSEDGAVCIFLTSASTK